MLVGLCAEAASVFLDPVALTFDDPDHSNGEHREITIGISANGRVLFVSHSVKRDAIPVISARKASRKETKQYAENIGIRPEYDLSHLKGGVRGKYYERAKAGTNLVLIEPDLAQAFPGEESVNRALRLLLSAANAATTGSRRTRIPINQATKRTPGKRDR